MSRVYVISIACSDGEQDYLSMTHSMFNRLEIPASPLESKGRSKSGNIRPPLLIYIIARDIEKTLHFSSYTLSLFPFSIWRVRKR